MQVNPPSNTVSGRTDDANLGLSFGTLRAGQVDDVLGDVPFNGMPMNLAYYLELQAKVAQETLFFQTISNIVKARQDASLNCVRNLKR